MISVIPFSLNGCPLRLCLLLEGECMNQKTKPSIQSHIVGDQNDMGFGSVLFRLGGVR